jgi:putative oxidoreductase
MTNNSTLIQRGLSAAQKVIEGLQFAAPLLTRFLVGVTFFYTGHGKLQNLDRTASFFSDLGIPMPYANAVFISSLEFFGGIALMLGLGTRVVAFLLSSTMVVALLTADKESFVNKFPAELTDVSPVMLLMFLIWLVLYGAGAVSLDRAIGRFFKRKEKAGVKASLSQVVNGSLA